MSISKVYQTKSVKQTFNLGKSLAKKITSGQVLALFGNLGAGKTVLAKGIAAGLGVKKIITSPTFILMKIYNFQSTVNRQPSTGLVNRRRSSVNKLIHIDCYRIKDFREVEAIGALEYFARPDSVVVIEWAEKIKPLLPKNVLKIKISLKKNNNREIVVG
ncbi:MAG: tRNA (adenosine(37)-N6)-threonylcarbamoyltransferase complex ATPase subunit type 1 TsaE [Patescibacteria group bacterium]